MLYLKALILSIVQGLTEFIPVSSSGHLIVFGNYLNFQNNDGNLFEIVIQLASILAVCIYFRKKLINVLFTIHNNKESRSFAYKFIIAFLPCAFVGLFLYKFIKTYLQNDIVVAISLIIGGVILLVLDRYIKKPKYNNIDSITNKSALKIGIYQIFSMIPGVSRSGSTIVGGLLSGLSRKTAVEFSFILAIPTILSATLFNLYKNIDKLTTDNIGVLIFGFIVTFIISMGVIKLLLNYISKHSFNIFGYYRIILGIVIILVYILR